MLALTLSWFRPFDNKQNDLKTAAHANRLLIKQQQGHQNPRNALPFLQAKREQGDRRSFGRSN
jgi:hypothetical protein